MPKAPRTDRFDEAYFSRYYGAPKTRVTSPEENAALVRAVTSLARYWGIRLESALDLGAGVGHWKRALAKELPSLAYRGVDVSAYAAATYGHIQADISRYRTDETFDLVICQGVLQYLDGPAVTRTLKNIGAMTGQLLYLEVLTKEDVASVIDRERTDTDAHLRAATFYRSRLATDFVTLGCGLFAPRRADHPFFELEKAE